jgi:RND family efflux transporter MFP subunit
MIGMKKILLVIGVLAMVSCGQQDDRKEIRKEIAQKKKEMNQIKNKIDELNEQLSELEGETGGVYQIPVFVKEMKPETFNHFINANGKVEAIQDAFISPETNGQITNIHVDEGDRVDKGQLLVSLNTSIIESNINEVKTSLELARETFEKQKRLWQDSVGSEMQYLQAKNNKESLERRLETLQEQLDMAKIKAPFAGIVERINQKVGELGTPGVQVLHLVNLKNLRVEADITEQYMASIKEGDRVKLSFPAYPEMTKEVPITRKGQVIDDESRTFVIEARLNNENEKIKPNQVCVVNVKDFSNDSALVIPSNVIKQDMKGDYVYILKKEKDKNIATKSYVTTGRSYNNETLVTKGLSVGDKVITSGYTQVSEGSEVNVKNKEKVVE